MLKPGMMIGDRYEILETVGSGGMSIVYKARCHKLNRFVAIKVLKQEFSDDKNFVSKFRIEAQSAAGLSHPNIVNVYDVGEDDGIYYIVMELVEGITLKEYIRNNGRLPVERAINFAEQIASGIEVAHENHTIHRDIKPQNIIVSNNGTLKVTDFGIARAATSNTVASNAMGSVHYISPEQARGGYSDERSDIYSLGITMYEMVTGRVPFEGDNNVTVALMHIQGEMIPPREYYPDIPASLEKIILKCTQKKPERRYLTASALIADLRRVATNPNGDFVVINPNQVTNDPTVKITPDEMNTIKQNANVKPMVEEEPVVDATPLSTPAESAKQVNPAPVHEIYDTEDDYDEDYEADEEEEDDIDELDDEGEVDPKLENLVRMGGIVAAVIVAMFIIFFVGKAAGWFKFGKTKPTTETTTEATVEKITMINVVGKTKDEAKAALEEKGIPYTIETQNSDTVAVDVVISQSKAEGEEVTAEYPVVIYVSAGQETVDMIDVVDYEYDRADVLLGDLGISTTHSFEYSDTIAKDHVIRTEPAAGSKVAKGTKVVLVISNGPEVVEVEVPNLENRTRDEAVALLTNAQLQLGNVTEEFHDTVPAGQVIRQSTAPGTKVTKDTAIDITISKGPEQKVETYSATFSGSIALNNYTFDEGEVITVKVTYEVGNLSYAIATITFSADGPTSIDIASANPEKVTGLASRDGGKTGVYATSNIVGKDPNGSISSNVAVSFAVE